MMNISVSFPSEWEAICIIAALIGFFMALLTHMISIGLRLPNLNAWAKSEYMQAAASFLIILFAAGMVRAGGSIVGEVTSKLAEANENIVLVQAAGNPANIGDPAKIAKTYLLEGPLSCEISLYNTVRMLNFLWEFPNSLSLSVGNVEAVGGGFFYAGKVSATHVVAQNIAYLALFHYVQYHMLSFSQYVMLQIFLPIGIVLRAFAPTRGAGGFVVAFALGFAFVFPISYLLIISLMPPSYGCTNIEVVADYSAAKAAYANEFLGDDPCTNNVGSIMVKKMATESNQGIGDSIARILSMVGHLYQQAVLYPMVALIITFTFVRQTSSLFGADLAEIGRGLIKII
jgi:hypothetical protein